MVAPAAGVVIDGPVRTPPPTGLLAAATVIEDLTERWENGVNYQPDSCADARVYDPCSTASSITSDFTDGASTSGSATFTSATAKFNAMDAGRGITGTNIPASTTILSVQSATSITLSQNATGTGTGLSFSITLRLPAAIRPGAVAYQPFPVEAYDTCTLMQFQSGEYQQRAIRALAAQESKAVEQQLLLSNVITANPKLQDTARVTQPVGTTTQGLRTGLARLVQAIADLNLGTGMIHARPYLVQQWFGLDLLYRDGRKLYTAMGNLVVPGSGYTGAAPDGTGAAANAEWAYATDALQIRRSGVHVYSPEGSQGAIRRATNSQVVRAERTYDIESGWCAVAAVKFDTTSTS